VPPPVSLPCSVLFFSLTHPAPTAIYTLSLHDALPICRGNSTRAELRTPDPSCNPYLALAVICAAGIDGLERQLVPPPPVNRNIRSEEHTSELQSRENLVCRLLLEKKKDNATTAARRRH